MSQPTYLRGHKITQLNLDPELGSHTAVCKLCGPVTIIKASISKGKQYYRCENSLVKKTDKAHYTKEHFLSSNFLSSIKEDNTAICSKCGEVKVHKRVNSQTGTISWACHESLVESRKKMSE